MSSSWWDGLRAAIPHIVEGAATTGTAVLGAAGEAFERQRLLADLEPVPSEWADAPLRKGWYMGDPERVNKVQASIRDEIVCRPSVDEGCEDEPAECNVAESSEEEGAGLYAPSEVT